VCACVCVYCGVVWDMFFFTLSRIHILLLHTHAFANHSLSAPRAKWSWRDLQHRAPQQLRGLYSHLHTLRLLHCRGYECVYVYVCVYECMCLCITCTNFHIYTPITAHALTHTQWVSVSGPPTSIGATNMAWLSQLVCIVECCVV
jgi:hypothetical protein